MGRDDFVIWGLAIFMWFSAYCGPTFRGWTFPLSILRPTSKAHKKKFVLIRSWRETC